VVVAATLCASGVPLTGASSACAVDKVERVVAVGDVHGAYDQFVAILQAAELIDTSRRWAGGRAHLVQLGDVVDRGPDSRKVLDLLRTLEREAERAGGRVHALLGNHEVARMLGDLRYVTAGEYAAFVTPQSEALRQRVLAQLPEDDRERALADTPLGSIELQRAFAPGGEYGTWLRSHETVARINGVLFVHGGISPAAAPLSCERINDTVRRELTEDLAQTRAMPLSTLAAGVDGPLWYRGLFDPDQSSASVERMLEAQHAVRIVVAHTVTPTGRIRALYDNRVLGIDTGMQPAYVQGGRASALEFRGDRITAIYLDRRDVLVSAAGATRR